MVFYEKNDAKSIKNAFILHHIKFVIYLRKLGLNLLPKPATKLVFE